MNCAMGMSLQWRDEPDYSPTRNSEVGEDHTKTSPQTMKMKAHVLGLTNNRKFDMNKEITK